MTSVIPIDSSSVLIEGGQHLCIRDLIISVCKKDFNQAGELWKKAKADLEAILREISNIEKKNNSWEVGGAPRVIPSLSHEEAGGVISSPDAAEDIQPSPDG
jgi:hypothetical protein